MGKMLKGAIASHTAPEVHDHVARRHRSCVKGVDDLKLPGSVPQHRALNALSQTCRAARAAPQAKRLGARPGANRPCPASARRWAWWFGLVKTVAGATVSASCLAPAAMPVMASYHFTHLALTPVRGDCSCPTHMQAFAALTRVNAARLRCRDRP